MSRSLIRPAKPSPALDPAVRDPVPPFCFCPMDCDIHYAIRYLIIDGVEYFSAVPKAKGPQS